MRKVLVTLTLVIPALILLSSCKKDDDKKAEKETFTDQRDGQVYTWVEIGNQAWMAENLKYLPSVAGPGTSSETEPHYYVHGYAGTTINEAKATENFQHYAVLYNWPAAISACPPGWHLPGNDEWTQLLEFAVLQGYPNSNVTNGAGNALKSCRQINSPLGGECNASAHPMWAEVPPSLDHYGIDAFGFSALPGGLRDYVGAFLSLTIGGFWWSSSESTVNNAWYNHLSFTEGNVISFHGGSKENGFSVRCVRD